jgi:signal peptidase II
MAFINRQKGLPFLLTFFIILADQGIKQFIVNNWPRNGTLIKDVFNNGLLYIFHVRNKAIAFSLGDSLPDFIRPFLFIILPVVVLGFLLGYYLKSQDFSQIQRWAVAGIIGGGLGNIIDRIFRPEGVVDFISVKFFGIEGVPVLNWDRWPTFNIADASVVVCCIMLLLTILIPSPLSGGPEKIKEEESL